MRVTEIFLQLHAAAVKNVFPSVAVKKYTRKSNEKANLYLPSDEKQCELAETMSEDELRERVWSLETRIHLLKRREYALLSDIRTEAEFRILVSEAPAPVEIVARAMKYYTPTKAMVLQLLDRYELQAVELIKAVPAAFDSLMPWEVLGVKVNEATPTDSECWAFAEALVAAKASWAPKFMEELRKVVPRNLGELGKGRFKLFFERAYDAKEDISGLMLYMAVFFPGLYAKVRENYYRYDDFSSYFCKIFPQLLEKLGARQVDDLLAVAVGGELEDWADAYAWLSIGLSRLDNDKIYDCILSSLPKLKKQLSEVAYGQLFGLLVEKAKTAHDINVLMSYGVEAHQPSLRRKLVASASAFFIQHHFPFTGWEEDLAKKALWLLAGEEKIPVQRLNELTSALQTAAINAMQAQAEIAALKADRLAAVEHHLLPEAELFLFSQGNDYQKYKIIYLKKYKVAEATFVRLLRHEYTSYAKEFLLEQVVAYASKWGLTREQYLLILQSQIKESALALQRFVEQQNPEEEQGVGGESTL